jgi:hypothetical protein
VANHRKTAKTLKTGKTSKKLLPVKNAKPASYKIYQKYFRKRLAEVNKECTFAPATAIYVHRNTDKQNN